MEILIPDIVHNASRYVVSGIVDSPWYRYPNKRFPHRYMQYRVAWEGYGPEEDLWEPFEMLEGTALQALQPFNESYLSKPRD